jgi:hypothetical protein
MAISMRFGVEAWCALGPILVSASSPYGRLFGEEQRLCIPVSPDDHKNCVLQVREGRRGRSAMDAMLWGLMVVGGPLVLGLVLFLYGQRRRRRTQSERNVSNEAARENWGKEKIR